MGLLGLGTVVVALQADTPVRPMIVTVLRQPTRQTTLADVVLGSIGMAGTLLLLAVLLGGLLAFVMLEWRRRHPPESDHLPSISPLAIGPDGPPSSPVR
jgi:hypothetical protein